jgi:hypothetical protein
MGRPALRLGWLVRTLVAAQLAAGGAALLAGRTAGGQAPAKVPGEWLSPAEAAGFEATPDYAETMEFLRRLAARMPEMRLESFGRSAAGRPLPLVIV